MKSKHAVKSAKRTTFKNVNIFYGLLGEWFKPPDSHSGDHWFESNIDYFLLGRRQAVSPRLLVPVFHRFESCRPSYFSWDSIEVTHRALSVWIMQ